MNPQFGDLKIERTGYPNRSKITIKTDNINGGEFQTYLNVAPEKLWQAQQTKGKTNSYQFHSGLA